MAEEDEIDILGDCSLDSFISTNDPIFDNTTNSDELLKCEDVLVSQNTELLKCDYTIHPQWLLDKPSTNPECWYSNNETSDDLVDIPSKSDQIIIENEAVDKSGWNEKEKDLLNRGIEIFGKSHVRLSQFIGSKTSGEVKNYLKNYYLDGNRLSDEIIFDCVEESVVGDGVEMEISESREVISENEIPASIEEVIAAVSTANPTVNSTKSKKRNEKTPKSSLNYKDIPSGHSLLKKNYITPNKQVNKTKEHKLERNKTSKTVQNEKKVKFKFKTKVIVPKKVVKSIKKINRKSTRSDTENSLTSEASISDIEIVTGNGLSVPVCNGEEVIKIKKENNESDSDIEIDVEDSEDEEDKPKANESKVILSRNIPEDTIKEEKEFKEVNKCKEEDTSRETVKKKLPDLNELNEEDVNTLMSMEFPSSEFLIDEFTITNLERFIHFEFFEGRSTKTPSRYLKIRNHILNVWKSSKPSYVTKTSIRHGLKQCGDVNCISRVHQFLEQIGAINFNCPQTSYVRPLYELVLTSANPPKEANREIENNFVVPLKLDSYYRNRNKKKFVNDGEGGYTLQHDDKGEVIHTTVVNEDPIQKKQYIKKPIIRLIYCRPFTENNPQDYQLTINLPTLILMDLHSHSSLSEIMGLIGGHWNPSKKTLKILRYEPCKNIASSSTHCDMCPITQAKAAENIHRDNMEVLGWFHSHPTFAPEPSQQDIDTQLSIQRCFGEDKPCIGVIMSPFSSHGALIASPFRCMVVGKKENFDDQFVPYKLKVEVESGGLDVEELLNNAWGIFKTDCFGNGSSKVEFLKPYFQDTSMTYLDKFISSVKMHLAKCTNVNKMTCDAVQQGLSNICCNRV